jgi:hypothetical protein
LGAQSLDARHDGAVPDDTGNAPLGIEFETPRLAAVIVVGPISKVAKSVVRYVRIAGPL